MPDADAAVGVPDDLFQPLLTSASTLTRVSNREGLMLVRDSAACVSMSRPVRRLQGAMYCWSGDDGFDRLFQRTGLGRRRGRFLPGLLELGPEFLKLFAAEAGPHFGEPVLLFLFDVMRDVLDQYRGLGIEALSLSRACPASSMHKTSAT